VDNFNFYSGVFFVWIMLEVNKLTKWWSRQTTKTRQKSLFY